MPKGAERLNRLPDYAFSVINEQVRAMQQTGADVIRLDVGNPDLPPPDFVIESLYKSAQKPGNHGYSGYRGIARFREAVAGYYSKRFGVTLDAEKQVLPLLGSKEGIVNLSLAYLDKGDLVLVPDVGYPSYAMGAQMAGADIHWMPLREENNFVPVLEDIPSDIAKRANLMWVNYPNNPTGVVVDNAFYMDLIRFCRDNDILLASDNPYVDVTFDGYRAPSPLEIEGSIETSVEFMSFSKTYNMAGWRLGALVGQEEALARLLRIKSNMDSGHFIPVYDAGIVAIEQASGEWIAERNTQYAHRRDMILESLPEIGLSAHKPQASLYVWAKVMQADAEVFVKRAREEAHVSMAYGGIYGPGGESYVRISISVPDDRLAEALDRLKIWYKKTYE
jgi:LL-diaminopimelate aminotransferase